MSGYCWAKPLKNKTTAEVTSAFKGIVESTGRSPVMLTTDSGTEFVSNQFKNYLRSIGTKLHVATGWHKAALAENCGKILKSKLSRYMYHYSTHKWAPEPIQRAVESMNARYLSVIKGSPDQFTFKDNHLLYRRRYGSLSQLQQKKPKLKVGNIVRLHLKKTKAFDKAYTQNFSTELYVVTMVIKSPPTYRYHIADLEGNEIAGTFYSQNLVLAAK